MIEAIVGDRVADSMTVVANEFGVSPQTVRGAWHPHGMTGKRGEYRLSEILFWRLEHLEQNRQYLESRKDRHNERPREIEVEERELKLASARSRFEANHGDLANIGVVRSEVYAVLTVLREQILPTPRSIVPMLPPCIAGKVSSKLEKKIRHGLSAAKTNLERMKFNESGEPLLPRSNGKVSQNGRPKRK